MSDRYREAAVELSHEVKIKRSRFIAHVRLVRSIADVQGALRAVEEAHGQANHNCWAYRLGTAPPQEYWSDAGEPSGTAGKPILGALDRAGVTNTMVVVTRYFGGIKLGVRGLIEAYGSVASEALERAGVRERRMTRTYSVDLPYETAPHLFRILAAADVPQSDVTSEYGASVRMICPIPLDDAPLFESTFAEWLATKRITSWSVEDE